MLLLVLSLHEKSFLIHSATLQLISESYGRQMRLYCEPMSNENYREKDGGARLEELWHVSMEGCAELECVINAIGLRST